MRCRWYFLSIYFSITITDPKTEQRQTQHGKETERKTDRDRGRDRDLKQNVRKSQNSQLKSDYRAGRDQSCTICRKSITVAPSLPLLLPPHARTHARTHTRTPSPRFPARAVLTWIERTRTRARTHAQAHTHAATQLHRRATASGDVRLAWQRSRQRQGVRASMR